MTEEIKKILVMDDEEIVGDIAKQMLVFMGYEAEIAHDGEEAIRLYKEQFEKGAPYLLVIMDLNVPEGMGGQEAIGEILAIDANAKAIVSSGYTNDPIMQRFGEYGFSGAIAKPFDLEGLKNILDSVA